MRDLSRISLFSNLLEKTNDNGRLTIMLQTNIDVLTDIEVLFLTEDQYEQVGENDIELVLNVLNNNIEVLRNHIDRDYNIDEYNLVHKLEKIYDDYINKGKINRLGSRNLFNQILNELGEYNTKLIPENEMPLPDRICEDRPQVFLSHAYDDRLYALALFDYFYDHNIYLYVDWMHQGKQTDGKSLKHLLTHELTKSKQLLFLRSSNSELNIQGNHMIRPWCAWELGNFYRKSDDKYLINLYSVDGYSNPNLQLHGLKLFTGIKYGLLDGTEI